MKEQINSLWELTDQAVDGLEESWRVSGGAEIADFLPSADSPWRRSALVRLIKSDQEFRWECGQQKLVEEYLREWPELVGDDESLRQLVEAECWTRGEHGHLPTAEDLQCRFPILGASVDLAQIEAELVYNRPTLNGTGGAEAPTARVPANLLPGDLAKLSLGARFGRYEIRSVLGEGAMGAVYRAYDTQLERDVALKIPRVDAGNQSALLERFIREAKTAGKIQHPNICPVFDAGQMDGTYYIAMALIEGQTLEQRLRSQPMAPQEAAQIVAALARALHAVHAIGIIHRDIKPSNVMINALGEPLLTDFGLARHGAEDVTAPNSHSDTSCCDTGQRGMTRAGQLLGTPAYMSPEQTRGQPADARSDVWSLGVVLYQALTGQLPFDGPLPKLLEKIAGGEPPAPCSLRPELPRPLQEICMKVLAKAPAQRYPSAAVLAEDLDAWIRGHPQGGGRPPRRRRRIALAAMGGAAVIFAAVFLYVVTGDGTLVLEVHPSDVSVTIDGRSVQIRSPRDEITLRVGDHQMEVSRDGFLTKTTSFSVQRNGRVEFNVRLTPAAERPVSAARPPKQPTPTTPMKVDYGPGAPPPALAPLDTSGARQCQAEWAKYLDLPAETTNSIGMKLVLIPPGEFDMGSGEDEIARALDEGKQGSEQPWYFERVPSEGPQHRVCISRPFYLGAFEVTQGEYRQVMGVNPSSYSALSDDPPDRNPPLSPQEQKVRRTDSKRVAGQDTSRHPVEMVSWEEAQEFCRRLSALPTERKGPPTYRLPREAEWEYACRAGSSGRWCFGDEESRIADYGWTTLNADGTTHPVGQKKPNAWGLYDMHGNVFEWCADRFAKDYYRDSPAIDPPGPSAGSYCVLRSGSAITRPCHARSAFRNYSTHGLALRYHNDGFRVVCEIPLAATPAAVSPRRP